MKLVLPLPPNRANSRWHWRTEKRHKDTFYLMSTALYPKLPKQTLEQCNISCDLYVWNIMDHDNAYGRLKWVLDWLQQRGYIISDNPKCIGALVVRQHIDRKNQRLELELNDA
jgi:hypothetical protein